MMIVKIHSKNGLLDNGGIFLSVFLKIWNLTINHYKNQFKTDIKPRM